MQDFKNNEKKKVKWVTGSHVGFYKCEICHGLSLCETLHFVLYLWSSYFAFFEVNITKLIKFIMATKRPFLNCSLPKVDQVIG